MRRLKKLLPMLLVALFLFSCFMSVTDSMERQYETDFNQDRIMYHVEKLTENGPRSVLQKEANEKALG